MFVGSINQELLAILKEMATDWLDRDVYIGCSGNFTVERVLSQAGITRLHGNDVSLYSCAIGGLLTGKPLRVGIKEQEYEWLSKYLNPGVDTVATLLLCSEMLKFADRPEPYHRRMWQAYTSQFASLHSQTVDRVLTALEEVQLLSFTAGDVVDYVKQIPQSAVVISFPPTYEGGYERLYKKIDEVFEWDEPDYVLFDDDRFDLFTGLMMEKDTWVTLRDCAVEELEPFKVGLVQTSLRNKPVYVYAGGVPEKARIAFPNQTIEPVPIPRLQGELKGPLRLVWLTQGQLNLLRSQYLGKNILPAMATVRLGVLAGDELIGAIAFSPSTYGRWCDAYMMSDFSVAPSIYARLSKLVLAAALSTETVAALEQGLRMRVRSVGTTAFTDKPVSMKYRGLFDLHDRKEGQLNYVGQAGRWSLEEGLQWWLDKHSNHLNC